MQCPAPILFSIYTTSGAGKMLDLYFFQGHEISNKLFYFIYFNSMTNCNSIFLPNSEELEGDIYFQMKRKHVLPKHETFFFKSQHMFHDQVTVV